MSDLISSALNLATAPLSLLTGGQSSSTSQSPSSASHHHHHKDSYQQDSSEDGASSQDPISGLLSMVGGMAPDLGDDSCSGGSGQALSEGLGLVGSLLLA